MNIQRLIEKLDSIEDSELKELVKELIEENGKLNSDVKLDELTSTYNRRILDCVKRNSVIAMCDIDGFKAFNDKYGHDKGDEVLKSFASTLKSSVRSDDIVCRYGGDEFVIAFKSCPIEMAKKRLEIIEEKLVKDNITFCAGLSLYDETKSLEESLTEADSALYKSKSDKKGKITIYNKRIKLIKK